LPQFFLNDINPDGSFLVNGTDFHHLSKVRRVKIDDSIHVRYKGQLYEATVINITSESILARLGEMVQGSKKMVDVTLMCAILKSGNFDFAIQKAVETGASRIIPVITERTIADISDKKKIKIDRWKKISLEASKQSLREAPPEICEPVDFKKALEPGYPGFKIIAHPGSESNVKDVLGQLEKNIPIILLIGPEGGFTERELSMADESGFTQVNFGFSHLRAETAVIVFLSIIIYEMSGK
jgi:16S rRNA (uracil1498-N3)-methyltransferase